VEYHASHADGSRRPPRPQRVFDPNTHADWRELLRTAPISAARDTTRTSPSACRPLAPWLGSAQPCGSEQRSGLATGGSAGGGALRLCGATTPGEITNQRFPGRSSPSLSDITRESFVVGVRTQEQLELNAHVCPWLQPLTKRRVVRLHKQPCLRCSAGPDDPLESRLARIAFEYGTVMWSCEDSIY